MKGEGIDFGVQLWKKGKAFIDDEAENFGMGRFYLTSIKILN